METLYYLVLNRISRSIKHTLLIFKTSNFLLLNIFFSKKHKKANKG